ncbi:MAG: hypothetical protein FJ280_25000 [Planctomycetes bacterium]|nr:hypothetical protein [Planctomycetota bacterium]
MAEDEVVLRRNSKSDKRTFRTALSRGNREPHQQRKRNQIAPRGRALHAAAAQGFAAQVAAMLGDVPQYTNVSIKQFGVIESLTAITRGPIAP